MKFLTHYVTLALALTSIPLWSMQAARSADAGFDDTVDWKLIFQIKPFEEFKEGLTTGLAAESALSYKSALSKDTSDFAQRLVTMHHAEFMDKLITDVQFNNKLLLTTVSFNCKNICDKQKVFAFFADIALKHGADVNAIDGNNNPPLTLAAYNNLPEHIDLLLQYKPNVNAQHNKNNTALIMAVFANNRKIVEKLLLCGADATIANSQRETALSLARKMWFDQEDGSMAKSSVIDLLQKYDMRKPTYL